jgi:hypothetical protein
MRRCALVALAALGWLATALPARASDPKQVAADEERLKALNLKIDDDSLLAFLRARTLGEAQRSEVELLIHQLGAIAFRSREKATAELIARGPLALEQVRLGINDPDLEVSRRCEMILQQIKKNDVAADAPGAVVRLLAARRPAGAAEVLLAYLPFAENEVTADDIREALFRVAVQDGKANKVLLAALSDKAAVRRGAAGEALARAGAEECRDELRALLKDPDVGVRNRVALALVLGRDKAAVPPLIESLVGSSLTQAWQIEDLLVRLTEGKSPAGAPTVSNDEASRKKARDAWLAWWQEHGKGVDLGVLGGKLRLLGYTTLVLLDQNRILEVDGNDNIRWQIDNVQFPLDVQVLPGDKILVAEYHGNLVTERNFKGEILWKRMFDGPQMAQRLDNGHTFIGGRYHMVELDGAGKQVFVYHAPGGEGIMKCMKLPSGEVVALFEDARVVRIDARGTELGSFRVELNTKLFGGRLYGLANGNVLIPHNGENKVVEYDKTGKKVWEVKIDQPIAAVRLANGNTIVTSMNQNRAVEFDQAGKEVWQYRASSRVTRALRR